jgi:hypothetical protein
MFCWSKRKTQSLPFPPLSGDFEFSRFWLSQPTHAPPVNQGSVA